MPFIDWKCVGGFAVWMCANVERDDWEGPRDTGYQIIYWLDSCQQRKLLHSFEALTCFRCVSPHISIQESARGSHQECVTYLTLVTIGLENYFVRIIGWLTNISWLLCSKRVFRCLEFRKSDLDKIWQEEFLDQCSCIPSECSMVSSKNIYSRRFISRIVSCFPIRLLGKIPKILLRTSSLWYISKNVEIAGQNL